MKSYRRNLGKKNSGACLRTLGSVQEVLASCGLSEFHSRFLGGIAGVNLVF